MANPSSNFSFRVDGAYKRAPMSEETKQRLKTMEKKQELPGWTQKALAFVVIDGETYEHAAARFDKARDTLKKWVTSKPGKLYREKLKEYMDNPANVARDHIMADMMHTYYHLLIQRNIAAESGDYRVASQIDTRLLEIARDFMGWKEKREILQEYPSVIDVHLNFPRDVLLPEDREMLPEAEYEIVEGANTTSATT